MQGRIGREINPKVFSVKERRAKVRAKNAFALDVLAKPKLFLTGDRDELAETGRSPWLKAETSFLLRGPW
jgi:hypothetical protein